MKRVLFVMAAVGLLPACPQFLYVDSSGTTSSSSSSSGGRSSSSSREEDNNPPTLNVQVPSGAALGATAVISASAYDDVQVESLEFRFHNALRRGGPAATVTAAELGEGYGTLQVLAWDSSGNAAWRDVDGFLVDLSPPVGEVVSSTVINGTGEGAHGALQVWVADAWMLRAVSVEFQGHTAVHVFPTARPSSLGDRWDESVETFDAMQLGSGSGHAVITVDDAAGNSFSFGTALLVDREAPTVTITTPTSGNAFTAGAVVTYIAADDSGPPTVEVSLGGALLARSQGSDTQVSVDTTGIPLGETLLELVAVDEAGNRSTPATVTVMVQ